MLASIAVRNFQSLHEVDLDLAPFTVIVGQSSSGKSAFTRALRTLTANRRGTDFISHGERVCTITARTEAGTVTLKRSRGTDNEYAIIPSNETAEPTRFTKLGGEVPAEVSHFIGIDPKEPINFAGQFDKPYLLDTAAPEVARQLGALTNVTPIFEAARESNRRKLNAAQTLRTRSTDLETIKTQSSRYSSLNVHMAAIGAAEEHIKTARMYQGNADSLQRLITAVEEAEQTLTSIRRNTEPIPSLSAAEDAARALARFQELLVSTRDAKAAINAAVEARALADSGIESAITAYDEQLRANGTCPTCHQSTEHVHTTRSPV